VETKTAPPPKAVKSEQEKHDEIVAAHRVAESEQQDALALTCADPKTPAPRCQPSCYAPEAKDPREGRRVAGKVEVEHIVCQRQLENGEWGPAVFVDELEPKLKTRPNPRGKPKEHKKGTWQADIEAALHEGMAKTDGVVVTGGNWTQRPHPLTHETLRCAAASQYTSLSGKLDACGGTGKLGCEAGGNAAAHALDVIHFRLAEARQLSAQKKESECQQAALEAIAVARGLPRWRQYKKLNVGQWKDGLYYRTRFDGVLDEDALFAAATTLGSDAESVYASCGGDVNAKTKAEQEQSFHACW
jgi:hypothetical protein